MKPKKALTAVLVVVAWFWTAYECDTIGIDVFDMLLKRFPGQVWVMAAVKVVLPWSTWPMEPTFTCGFVRSNLSLAIGFTPGILF